MRTPKSGVLKECLFLNNGFHVYPTSVPFLHFEQYKYLVAQSHLFFCSDIVIVTSNTAADQFSKKEIKCLPVVICVVL